jgi:GTP:adenosylcobinamide-phosphate guanylyltransferase
MHAIITAGGVPQPDESLYQYTQGENKALLDIAGKLMIQWVLDALSGSELIDDIVIVGLDETVGLDSSKPLHYLPSHGRILDNIKAGTFKVVELDPEADLLLIVSSDIPAITTEMVDWVIRKAEEKDVDILYTVVERQSMEARFPNANRSYIKLKGSEVCGGDMNAVKVRAVTHNEEIWDRLEATRKSALKQAAIIGFDTLFLVLFRLVDVNTAAAKVARRLGLTGYGAITPYAEIAMDVDKPHQLDILREDLAKKI